MSSRLRSVLSIDAVWTAVAVLPSFVVAASNPIEDDTWWVLKLGEILAGGMDLKAPDPLTFPPHPDGYVNAQWLAQRWYHAAYGALGLAGIPFVNALQVAGAFLIVFHLAWRRSGDVRLAAVCTLAGSLIAASNLNARAQTLALPLFALTLWLLWQPAWPGGGQGTAAVRGGRLLALGAVAAVWANVHGSFWLGPVLALALWTGAFRSWFFLVAAGVQGIAAMLNPHGTALFGYVLSVTGHPVVREAITEWRPPSVGDLPGAIFFVTVLGGAVMLACRIALPPRHRVASQGRRLVPDVLLLIVFGGLGLLAVKNLVWWGLILPPLYAGHLALREQAPVRTQGHPVANGVLLGVLAFLGAIFLPWVKGGNTLLPAERRVIVAAHLPQEAADRLEGWCGRLMAYQPWAGYLEWRLHPAVQLMADGRIELRTADFWQDFALVNAGSPDWEERLEKYRIRLLIVDRKVQAELAHRAIASPAWDPVHLDPIAAVFLRQDRPCIQENAPLGT